MDCWNSKWSKWKSSFWGCILKLNGFQPPRDELYYVFFHIKGRSRRSLSMGASGQCAGGAGGETAYFGSTYCRTWSLSHFFTLPQKRGSLACNNLSWIRSTASRHSSSCLAWRLGCSIKASFKACKFWIRFSCWVKTTFTKGQRPEVWSPGPPTGSAPRSKSIWKQRQEPTDGTTEEWSKPGVSTSKPAFSRISSLLHEG